MRRLFSLALHWQILIAMLVGATLGVVLNAGFGDRSISVSRPDLDVTIHDTSDRIEIDIVAKQPGGATRNIVVDETGQDPEAFGSVAELRSKDPAAYQLLHEYGLSPARWIGDTAQKFGGLFLRMLKMVAIPLIITSLITGVTGLQSAGRLGRMFSRTMGYYVVTSMLAITTGIAMVNLIRPGLKAGLVPRESVDMPQSADLGTVLFQQVEALIPENPIAAMAEGNFLSIIAFSLGIGIFTLLVGGEAAELIRRLFNALFEVMMRWTMAIIHLAPLGVFLLILSATATQGVEVFRSLAWYMLAVFLALGVHAAVTLPLILRFVAKRSPLDFARAMSPALLTAFSSASSNATLPLTIANVEQRAGVSNRVSSFVLPLGATINMDGTALYEAVAVLFIAQLYRGENLPLVQQLIVAFTALLASIGAAGIPHAGLVMMIIILQAVGLPTEMQGVIIAVDRVLDMCRTSVNVWSDACGCAVIARFDDGSDVPAVEAA